MLWIEKYNDNAMRKKQADLICEMVVLDAMNLDYNAYCRVNCFLDLDVCKLTGDIYFSQEVDIDKFKKSIKELIMDYRENIPNIYFDDITYKIVDQKEIDYLEIIKDYRVYDGYVRNDPSTRYHNLCFYLANALGCRIHNKTLLSDPFESFDLTVAIDEENGFYEYRFIQMNCYGSNENFNKEKIINIIDVKLKELFENTIPSLASIDHNHLLITSPANYEELDNYGESNSSLSELYYGDNVKCTLYPIIGTDIHCPDRIITYKAKQLAMTIARNTNYKEIYTRIIYRTYDPKAFQVEAYGYDEFNTKYEIDVYEYADPFDFTLEHMISDTGLAAFMQSKTCINGYFIEK